MGKNALCKCKKWNFTMTEYWESRFKNEGEMWKSEPSDCALNSLRLFKYEKIDQILIPGFGYGRNATLFIDNGFKVTGIEISRSAIELARESPRAHWLYRALPLRQDRFSVACCGVSEH